MIRFQFTPNGDIEKLESELPIEIYANEFNTN